MLALRILHTHASPPDAGVCQAPASDEHFTWPQRSKRMRFAGRLLDELISSFAKKAAQALPISAQAV